MPPVLPRAHPEYLAIVLDWFSRRVLSWGVSITMETSFCVETLEDALARHGKPDIFNTDQGSSIPTRVRSSLARPSPACSPATALRSAWTAAKMWMVNLLACGLSTAINSTPESISVAMKAKFRDRRSSLAMTSFAFCFLQSARAGLSFRFPLSISVNSAMRVDRLAVRRPYRYRLALERLRRIRPWLGANDRGGSYCRPVLRRGRTQAT